MFEGLTDFLSSLGNWGYLIIFLLTFLESSAFTGMLVPGETGVIMAGFLSSQGNLKILNSIFVVFLGTSMGDSLGYALGRIVGRGYFERHKRLLFIKLKHIEKAERYFQQHGGKTVFLGKYVGFLRSFGPFVAGLSKMKYRSFIAYDLSTCLLWTLTFSLLGYFFGISWHAIERWSGHLGIFIFLILIVIVSLSYFHRTLIKKQSDLREWYVEKYNKIINSAWVANFKNRHPNLSDILRRSISPWNYLGMHLSVGLLISGALVWIFGKTARSLIFNQIINNIDQWVINKVLYFRDPAITSLMIGISFLGSLTFIALVSFPLSIYLLLKKKFDMFLLYILTVFGGGLLNFVLKLSVRRDRPIDDYTLTNVTGFSFPSGHAMLSIVFYGIVSYYIATNMRSWRLKSFVILLSSFLVLMIGFTRIYLQVHYLSDVVAGYMGGLFWLVFCMTGFEVYKRRRANSQERPITNSSSSSP